MSALGAGVTTWLGCWPTQAAAPLPVASPPSPLASQLSGSPLVEYSWFKTAVDGGDARRVVTDVLVLDSRTLAFQLRERVPPSQWTPHVVTQPPALLDGAFAALAGVSAALAGTQTAAESLALPRSVFRTTLPAPASVDSLVAAGVRVSVSAVDGSQNAEDVEFLVRLGLLLAVSAYVLNADGGLGSLLKRPAKMFGSGAEAARASGGVTLADVAGCEEAKDELQDIVNWLKSPDKYARLGGRVPRGVLLVGPPGTGKTLLAKAVAGEAGVPFFAASASEFVELFVGLGGRRVRTLFEDARKRAPCVIFIDELDAVGKSRSGGNSSGSGVAGVANEEREQTLNQLLTEMDGFAQSKDAPPVIVLAATNRPDSLDAALRRPGRFDRTVAVSPPDRAGRAAIMAVHLGKLPAGALSPDVALASCADHVAASTVGFTGADLANVVNEAALLAARRGATHIALADLDAAVERGSSAGIERPSMRLSDAERHTVAIHEAGHAVVGHLARTVAHLTISKVSVIPRGVGALGWTQALPNEDRYLASQPQLRAMLVVYLAGRAAEQHLLRVLTSGAADDLSRATGLAADMVASFGMCPAVGPRAVGRPDVYADSSVRPPGPLLASAVDDAMNSLLRDADAWAVACVAHNAESIRALAAALLRDDTVSGDSLRSLLAQASLPPGVTPFWDVDTA